MISLRRRFPSDGRKLTNAFSCAVGTVAALPFLCGKGTVQNCDAHNCTVLYSQFSLHAHVKLPASGSGLASKLFVNGPPPGCTNPRCRRVQQEFDTIPICTCFVSCFCRFPAALKTVEIASETSRMESLWSRHCYHTAGWPSSIIVTLSLSSILTLGVLPSCVHSATMTGHGNDRDANDDGSNIQLAVSPAVPSLSVVKTITAETTKPSTTANFENRGSTVFATTSGSVITLTWDDNGKTATSGVSTQSCTNVGAVVVPTAAVGDHTSNNPNKIIKADQAANATSYSSVQRPPLPTAVHPRRAAQVSSGGAAGVVPAEGGTYRFQSQLPKLQVRTRRSKSMIHNSAIWSIEQFVSTFLL